MTDQTDYDDPRAVLTVLRRAYYQLLAGKQARSVEFTTGGGTKRIVTYQKADLATLKAEITRLEAETSGRPSRGAILAG